MGFLLSAVAYRGAFERSRSSLALCCILGPKVNTPEKLAELRRAGVNIGTSDTYIDSSVSNFRSLTRQPVRMNFSHGSYEYHQSVVDNTRKMTAGTSFFWIRPTVWRADLNGFIRSAADPEGRPVAIALDTVCPVPLVTHLAIVVLT